MPVLRTVLALGPRRWPGVLLVVGLAAAIEVSLRCVPLDRLARWLGTPLLLDGEAAPVGRPDPAELTAAESGLLDTAWRVLRRPPFDATCLRRALVGGFVLRRHHPRLRVGVAKRAGLVTAHAWVEVDGVSLDPEGTAAYRVLRSPGTPGR